MTYALVDYVLDESALVSQPISEAKAGTFHRTLAAGASVERTAVMLSGFVWQHGVVPFDGLLLALVDRSDAKEANTRKP